jgi:hypothetical protein
MFMADYAIQAVSAGTHATSAWMLDDNMHIGFTWGMWKSKENGFALKPWFYPWSLICRYHDFGATVYKVNTGNPNIRMTASRMVNSTTKKENWTICFV